jgi:hypothetical protein
VSEAPTLRILSLGAGRQSTALAILSATGRLPKLDAAIFADTGWEPRRVYEHLDRLAAEVLAPAGIPLYRVQSGNIRADALDPSHRFASMPLYVANPDGSVGMGRRQCTSEYKLKPIKAKVRNLLGAPWLVYGCSCGSGVCHRCQGSGLDARPGRVPAGRWAEQWVGFSVDESARALDTKGTAYLVSRWPLLELGLSVDDCLAVNEAAGFPQVVKSACIGCPYHRNRQWRRMRDETPEEFADAVDFDERIRNGTARANATGTPLRGQQFLHESRRPLDLAPIDRVTSHEWATRQGDILTDLSAASVFAAMGDDEAEVIGCGPHTCRIPGDPDDDDEEDDAPAVAGALAPGPH